MNYEEFFQELALELRALAKAKDLYAPQLAPNFSIFNYIQCDEMMLSRILADLLNPHGHHAQKALFLKFFIQHLNIKSDNYQFDLECAEVKTEALTITSQTKRRMDIYIRIPCLKSNKVFGICIENKPFAMDQFNQLKDYYQELNLAHPEHLWHLVYLTPYGSDPSPMSISSKDWEKWKKNQQSTALAYTDLSDWLTHTSSLSLNPKVKNFLDAFHAYINNKFIGLNDMSEHEIIEKIINKNDDFHLIFEKIYRHGVQIKYELNKKIAKLKEYFHIDNKKIKVLMNVYAKNDPSMLLCCLYFDFKIKELKAFIDINAYHHGYEVTLAERTYNLNQTVLLQEILHLLGYESLPLTSNNRVLVFSYSKDVDQHQIYEDVDKLISDLIEYHLSTIN